MLMQVRGFQRTGGGGVLLGLTRLQWKCGHCRFPPPSLVRFTAGTVSQLVFSSPTLMSLADHRQTPRGDWSVTGNGGGERGEGERKSEGERGEE